MSGRKIGWIERLAARVGLVPAQKADQPSEPAARGTDGALAAYPPFAQWGDWLELDAKRRPRHYQLIPTTCFNCEAACGLLAYVDRETGALTKLEGNPLHPGSRGKNCAKGPATINQVNDPDRILHPLRRVGRRGSGQWERVSWETALTDIAGRIREALDSGRSREIMYHVGRPGHEGFMERLLTAWGVDGHNSHTNVCSSSARLGYQMTFGYDRPSPDFEHAQLILLISAHLESGHYFNPHAQRIIDAKNRGARIVVIDPRLSNTAASADVWIPARPGTEAAVLLAAVRLLLERGDVDRSFVRDWVDWRGFLRARHPEDAPSVDRFLERLYEAYESFTPEEAAAEAGIDARLIEQLASEIARAGTRVSAHVWRAAATGNEWGWQVARVMGLITALTGSVATPGGTSPHAWNKFKPSFWSTPEPVSEWNELQWPREYPLSFYEMSILLPHFLREGRGKLAVYFTRVYNPVWTNPDGFAWLEALRDEAKVGCFVALTPTWNESAFFADYVLPMGHSPERHDIQSQETHAGVWLSFRQPVLRVFREQNGQPVASTVGTNPGEVWEEDEFWIDLTWRIDPDGSRGIRRHYESPYRSGEKISTDEYYRWIFENAVPGLPQAAAEKGLTPLEYMRRVGAFEVARGIYRPYLERVAPGGAVIDPDTGIATVDGKAVGVEIDGEVCVGFPTPSRRIEVHSQTLVDWGFAGQSIPDYEPSHVGPHAIDPEHGVYVLLPTFRLPTMIHTRSANSKWLNEISHSNPLWVFPDDAARHGIADGDLVRVETAIGHFVNRARLTDAIRPGVLGCSHHMGRWRLENGPGSAWSAPVVRIEELDEHRRRLRVIEPVAPFASADPDTQRIWWRETGVNQNLAFPVQPDPASGMHCWHQVVKLSRAHPDDRYGDVVVDLRKSKEHCEAWLAKARPAPGPGGLRRPLWIPRPVRPRAEAYRLEPS
ncbi:MAG: molybdopterin-dependent oxidoreductase [Planctomycetota bacterium]